MLNYHYLSPSLLLHLENHRLACDILSHIHTVGKFLRPHLVDQALHHQAPKRRSKSRLLAPVSWVPATNLGSSSINRRGTQRSRGNPLPSPATIDALASLPDRFQRPGRHRRLAQILSRRSLLARVVAAAATTTAAATTMVS